MKRDDGARDDRVAVFAGGLEAPMGEEVPASGIEKGRVGAADRVDGNDAALLVDREPDRDRALFLIEQLRRRIGRLHFRLRS